MLRVVTVSVCGIAVVLALAWAMPAQPTSVAGQAHPWSGNTSEADAAAAFERCVEIPMYGGYHDRPRGTLTGYAGDDVAAVNFRTPDGRVIPGR